MRDTPPSDLAGHVLAAETAPAVCDQQAIVKVVVDVLSLRSQVRDLPKLPSSFVGARFRGKLSANQAGQSEARKDCQQICR